MKKVTEPPTREQMKEWLEGLKARKAYLLSELKGVESAILGMELALDDAGPGAPPPRTMAAAEDWIKECEEGSQLQRATAAVLRLIAKHQAINMDKALRDIRKQGHRITRTQLLWQLYRAQTRRDVPIRAQGKGKSRTLIFNGA
jgi:hypothetical protein